MIIRIKSPQSTQKRSEERVGDNTEMHPALRMNASDKENDTILCPTSFDRWDRHTCHTKRESASSISAAANPTRKRFSTTSPISLLSVLLCLLLVSPSSVLGQGPVYVDANAASTVQLQSSIDGAVGGGGAAPLVTQTVYGFLDFTTTIGNTLMIFSPQSQAAVVPEVKESASPSPAPSTPSTTSTPIDTKPPPSLPDTNPVEIKPSKTVATPAKSSDQKKAADEKKEKTTISKKAASSVVNLKTQGVPKASIVSSVVEVVGGPPSASLTPKVAADTLTTAKTQPSVVVFSKVEEVSPAPGPAFSSQVNIVSSKVEEVEPKVSSVVQVKSSPKPVSSKVQVLSSSKEEPAISGNNLDAEAEYDFLSRQPSEVVDETYKVIDLRTPNSKAAKHHRASSSNTRLSNADSIHPTGLVTSMGGTIVKDGQTTVHETSVLGTYINGKYAQILHSTSHIYQQHHNKKPKPSPASQQQSRILKTAAPSQPRANTRLEPTPAATLQEESALPLEALFNSPPSGNLIRQSRRPAVGNSPPPLKHSNRFTRPNKVVRDDIDVAENEDEQYEDAAVAAPVATTPHSGGYKKNRHGQQQAKPSFKLTGNSRFSRPQQHSNNKANDELATVSVYSDQAPPSSRRHQSSSSSSPSSQSSSSGSRRGGFRPGDSGARESTRDSGRDNGGRRSFKPSKASSNSGNDHQSTSLYKFKLSRPSGRWQYKTTPKPRIQIRRQDNDLENGQQQQQQAQQLTSDQHQSSNSDLEGSNSEPQISSGSADQQQQLDPAAGNSIEPTVTAETIKVEISTPADFKDTYYEIQTIKSPYTFQVGTLKNTRFITVTSTVEKSLVEPTEAPQLKPSEPLTENILATATNNVYDNKEPPLDSSIATLPPIALAGDAETPPLETMTESFSTTQLMLKTHLLPVIKAGNTSTYTLVQSYHVTRLVTAVKTLPPMEVYQFVPSKTLNEFNTRLDEAGSELHLELEFGDNNQDGDELPNAAKAFPPDLDLANVGSDFDLSEMDKTKFPDGHLRLKKAHQNSPNQNQIQPAATAPQEQATPSLSPEQLQQLALYRFLNPNAPLPPQLLTTSRPVLKVETIYESHVIPLFNGQSTLFSTISRPIATVSKTEYEVVTNSLALPPIQPPVNTINPFLQQQQLQQPQFAVTSSPFVTQTMVTATDSKILKLTFGAKTAYTTLYSTKVVPTVLTTYLTASVPVQPTVAAFPGYFPAPYNPFPFNG